MKPCTLLFALLLSLSCSAIDPGGLPGAGDFERWARACTADGSVSTACLRAQAVAWALNSGEEGNLLSVLADLLAWWAATPHAAEAPAPTLSGELGVCPVPGLWTGRHAPALDTWRGDADQILPIWGVVFSCAGRQEKDDYVLENGLKWSEVRRRFERQTLDGPGGVLDCEPAPVLPVACEHGQDVAIRWARSGDAAMRRADVFGYAAQTLSRYGGEVYGPWGVVLGANVEEYRTAGMYLALCGLDSIVCPAADEAAGKAVLRALQR